MMRKTLLFLFVPLLCGWGVAYSFRPKPDAPVIKIVEKLPNPLSEALISKRQQSLPDAYTAAGNLAPQKKEWIRRLVLQEWVRQNPAKALAFVRKDGTEEETIFVLCEWARLSPREAVKVAVDTESKWWLNDVLEAAACVDLEWALSEARRIYGDEDAEYHESRLRKSAVSSEISPIEIDADGYVDSIPSQEPEEAAKMLKLLTKERSDLAMRYFYSLPSNHQHRKFIAEAIGEEIITQLELSSDDLAALLQAGGSTEYVLGQKLGTADPETNLIWLKNIPEQYRERLRAMIIVSWGQLDPHAVTAHLESLPPGEVHWNAVENTKGGYHVIWDFEVSNTIKEKAVEWLDTLSDDEFSGKRSDVMVQFVPEYLISRCQRLPNGELGSGILAAAARSKHSGIAEFVSSIPAGELKDQVVQSLVSEPEQEHAGWRRGWQLDIKGFTPLVESIRDTTRRENLYRSMAITYAKRHKSTVRDLRTVEEIYGGVEMSVELRGEIQEILDGAPIPE